MKKLVSLLLAVMIMTANVFANADLPAFLTETYNNYTADYSISMTFDNSEKIIALLEEIEMPEQISYFVDMKTLLKSLLTYDGKMNLQADFSENYDKIKLALTTESTQLVNVNSNLNASINQKAGMWMNMDLSDAENPIFDIIYSHPFLNKYFTLTSDDMFSYAPEAIDMLKSMFNKEYMDSINKLSTDLFAKYATINGSGNKYTVTMDNDGLTALIDELMLNMQTFMPITDKSISDVEFPSVKGWQLLGEDGIECVYTLKSGKLSSEKATADISIALDQIYTAITGEEWTYTSADTLDFTIEVSANVSKIGSTKVEIPVLTEENSFTISDMESAESYPEEEAPVTEYPAWYVDGYCNDLPIVDGEIYVPLRQTIESAYAETAKIDYNNGVVTISSEYFPGFNTLTMTIGTDKVYADNAEYAVGNIFTIDGSTYVNNKLFSEILGWELTYAQYDLVNDEYSYGFWTERY